MKHHPPPLAARLAALTLAGLAAVSTDATAQSQKPASEQVVVPEVDRRDIKPPRYPSNDFSVGAYIGSYSTENFGTSLVYGVRLGYAITEDIFVEAVYGQTTVSDDAFRQILPGGIFANTTEKLSYYNLSVGYNVLPGEVFIGRTRALPSALYLIGGVGSTDFNGQNNATFNFGLGWRAWFKDSFALQVDVRDHVFSLDILGQRQSTQNLELTFGATFYF
jgi:outer membrane beta-barrel protein